MRLRRSNPEGPGWTRRRAGRGFVHLDEHGARLDGEDARRVKALMIPPAWQDVWICPRADGHIQAIGTDEAARRQYLYHPQWRARRDRLKHDHVLDVARRLPRARERVRTDLRREGLPRERVLALAFALLDVAYLRIGNESYARDNGSYGLTTLRRRHARLVELVGGAGEPATGASGVAGAGASDEEATPKDFRTWHATVLAARGLGEVGPPPRAQAARRKVVAQVVRTVAAELGNTPAVCRASYIDPRVVDRWERGETIGRPRTLEGAERKVLRLLTA